MSAKPKNAVPPVGQVSAGAESPESAPAPGGCRERVFSSPAPATAQRSPQPYSLGTRRRPIEA